MTRKIALHTTVAAAAFAALTAPAFAQNVSGSNSVTDTTGNSPAITEDGMANEVASQRTVRYGRADSRYSVGIAEWDGNDVAVTEEVFAALSATAGASFQSESGEEFGTVREVRYNARGFPELVVDLVPRNELDLETLVVSIQPDNTTITEDGIVLDLTVEEMIAKAQQEGVRNDATGEITIY